ncbi:citramalate synthase, partial [Eubacteriales bacterium OttesenSCG-928-G02]|nr:citramalate synthase [Eubacteriales bacterium OttesenSCG-928-G02]
MKRKIFVLDTTLRDGAQSVEINLTLRDKVNILKLLDTLDIDFIEAGLPGISDIDEQLFSYLKEYPNLLNHSKPVAFTLLSRNVNHPEEDTSF